MQEFNTPMMKQYEGIKKQYPDCLLLYRMGDFYELFKEDALIGARVLNITLTSKAAGKDGKVPMAGVPYHAVDTYLAKLVKAGYKVAICEQLSPPNKKGLVERDVVRVVTPGTLMDEGALEKKENNFIIAIDVKEHILAFSIADLSTGFFATTQFETQDFEKVLADQLAKYHPVECILSESLYSNGDFLKILKKEQQLNIFPFSSWDEYASSAKKSLRRHFNVATLESFAVNEHSFSIQTAAVLLAYLKETQKGAISHIKKIVSLTDQSDMLLDRSTMINLELFSTIREHETKGSLLSVLDNTQTAMGGRLLKSWMKMPLTDKKRIEERLDTVSFFIDNPKLTKHIGDDLIRIPDIERLLSRLAVNLGNARDLINIKLALGVILHIKKQIKENKRIPQLLNQKQELISKDLEAIVSHIGKTIVDEPPITTKEGRMIREGVNEKLDMYRNTISKSKTWIMELEKAERIKTGINTLKVRFNKVFGFYIEVTRANSHHVPNNYMRRQTLVNGERFITKELKEHEEIILTAEEKINEIEFEMYQEVLSFVLDHTKAIQNAGESIAVIDCLINFAILAQTNRYTKPTLLYSGEIKIKQGRHPVVEKLLVDSPFVPNDVTLDNTSQQLLLITGPNMAGKSVYIRQVALIVYMAQLGSFVPAKSAHISITDRIFVRSGASDVITSGLSTFMVEMVETAYILHNATKHSLIVMDEIGRGTSTYDGISIAWAVAQYLVTSIKPSPKTLFATHYHELQALEEQNRGSIKNFHMAVTSERGEPIFLHTILPGGASSSFGVAVAKLAGIPQTVIENANDLLQTLELRHALTSKETLPTMPKPSEKVTIQNTNIVDHLIHKELSGIDISTMTPLEALNKLAEIKNKLKLFETNQKEEFLKAD